MRSKIPKITTISYEEFTDYTFEPPTTFYIMTAMQEYIYFHTSKRATAQEACDEMFGKGRYTVKASKIQKGNGEITVRGKQFTKGQKR